MIHAFFQFPRAPTGAIESVNGGFYGVLVRFHQPRRKMIDLRQTACRSEALESIDQFIPLVAAAHHHRR